MSSATRRMQRWASKPERKPVEPRKQRPAFKPAVCLGCRDHDCLTCKK